MLSTHYISITMRIFYIDWQHHWAYDWTMNIGANAQGKRTVQNSTIDRLDQGTVSLSRLPNFESELTFPISSLSLS